MSKPREHPFGPVVREVVRMLVRGDYTGIEVLTGGVRLSAEELAAAVSECGVTLIEPPSATDAPLDIVEIRPAPVPSWSVDVPMWSVEERRSDVTLQLTVRKQRGGAIRVEVDNLHVL